MSVIILIPSFNEEQNIEFAFNEIDKLFDKIDHKILFVDDGSSDGTWNEIICLTSKNRRAAGIRLAANRGKECAIDAGLRECEKIHDMECVIVMDCDLQHPPKIALQMYEMWKKENYDFISGIKETGNRDHIGFSNLFNKVFSKLSDIDMINASDFKLLSSRAVAAVNNYREHDRFFRAIAGQIGMRTASISFRVEERKNGETKWNIGKLIKYAVSNIISYTHFPALITSVLSLIFFISAIVCAALSEWAGFISSIGTSCVLVAITSSGLYISRIYDEIRGRPNYFIWEKSGFED